MFPPECRRFRTFAVVKIRYLPHTKIDKTAWNKAVDTAANGQIYAYSWYLDCMAENWDALICENYAYIMPLPWNGKWAGVRQIYQPPFTQQLGVFGKEKPSAEIIRLFLEAIPSSFRYVRLQMNEANRDIAAPKFSVQSKRNMLLDLSQDYETIYKNYRSSLRRRIRKAESALEFAVDKVTPQELVQIYKTELNDKIGYTEEDYERAERLMQLSAQQEKSSIYSVHFSDGRFAAGLYAPRSHGRIVQLFGPSSAEGKAVYAFHFLLHSIFKKYAGQNLIFDFEGSEIPPVYEFFRGFRPDETSYPVIVKDDFPLWIKAAKAIREKL